MKTLVTTPSVDIALRTLEAASRKKVRSWFDHLRNWDEDAYAREHSYLLDPAEKTFVLQAPSDLRIFFQLQGDTVTVVDIGSKQSILKSAGGPENE